MPPGKLRVTSLASGTQSPAGRGATVGKLRSPLPEEGPGAEGVLYHVTKTHLASCSLQALHKVEGERPCQHLPFLLQYQQLQ